MADFEEKLLAMSEEGAVLVRAGRVVYANAAARPKFIRALRRA